MIVDKIKALISGKSKVMNTQQPEVSNYNSNIDTHWLLGCLKNGSYDNNFSSISRIAETFAEIVPFAVDDKGDKIENQPNLINVLRNPNLEMSGHEFAETLITMMLVHPIVYVLAWHRDGNSLVAGGPLTPDNIAGFTFLENASAVLLDGNITYRTNDGKIYNRNDVLTFSLNVNPYSLISGYSPSLAAKKWATVDDYVADYQAGYFKNGAVPAGQMIVTAASIDDFNKTVDKLQANHRGASNANNIVYVHRPTSSIDGKPMAAQIEWVPFSTNSNDTALQSLFDQANKKIDTTFGVPQEIKGYLSNSNYASVEVANYIFERYVVYPKLVKVWAKFTHELNRMTGGLGFAISFDYELPVLTDALTSQVESLNTLLNQGFTVESSVKALKLPTSFLDLEKTSNAQFGESPVAPVAENMPEQNATKSLKSKDLAEDQVEEQEEQVDEVDPEIVVILSAYMTGIISEAIRRYLADNPEEPLTAESLKNWLEESGYKDRNVALMVAILTAVMDVSGQSALDNFAAQLSLEDATFTLTSEEQEELNKRISTLLSDYGNETVDNIQAVVDQATYEGWYGNREEMRQALQNLNSSNEYRVDRWANSEQHFAVEMAVLYAATQAGKTADRIPVKTWRINPASPDVCANCIAMNGETVPVNKPFSNGDMVPHYHPWCYCTMEMSFQPAIKTVKINCPHCGRYMCESTGGNIKGIICANSKCKRRYDIEVFNGKIKAKEVKKED